MTDYKLFKEVKFMLANRHMAQLEELCKTTGLSRGEIAKAAFLQQLGIIDRQSFWNKVPVQQREILRSH